MHRITKKETKQNKKVQNRKNKKKKKKKPKKQKNKKKKKTNQKQKNKKTKKKKKKGVLCDYLKFYKLVINSYENRLKLRKTFRLLNVQLNCFN